MPDAVSPPAALSRPDTAHRQPPCHDNAAYRTGIDSGCRRSGADNAGAKFHGCRSPSSSIATSGRCSRTTVIQCHGPDPAPRRPTCGSTSKPAPSARWTACGQSSPGDVDHSELYRRITSRRWRRAHAAARLRQETIGRTRSIADRSLDPWRSAWQKHWAFMPVQAAAASSGAKAGWVRNPIDAFVLARLEAREWRLAGRPTRRRCLRRVTLDLTGLPPTPAEVDAFLADTSPDAYERVVDRLLASPRYGERMASAGSTRPAMPTPAAIRATASATCGGGAIG